MEDYAQPAYDAVKTSGHGAVLAILKGGDHSDQVTRNLRARLSVRPLDSTIDSECRMLGRSIAC